MPSKNASTLPMLVIDRAWTAMWTFSSRRRICMQHNRTFCSFRPPGCLTPSPFTAAERAVKGDGVKQPGGLKLQKVLLCCIQILLREENVHIAVHALSITSIGKVEAFLLGVEQQFLRLEFFVENGAAGQRV